MIDSSKKQQQGFPEILTAEDFEPFKEKECLEGSNQKSLKEGQSVSGQGQDGHVPVPDTLLATRHVCLLSVHCDPYTVQVLCGDRKRHEWFAIIGTNTGTQEAGACLS